MKKEKIIAWIRAFRVFTLTASFIPVFLGGILAVHNPDFNLLTFILSILALVTLQIGANLLNDSDDFTNKVDTKESYNSSGVIVDQLLECKTVKIVSYFFLFAAFLLGLYPVVSGGIVLWILALLGIAAAYFYTRKPFEFKYHGLGLPLIFIMFGPLPVLGTYYLETRSMSLQALIYSIMIGLFITNILHANDIRDIPTDTKAGIKTCSILVGVRKAKQLYVIMVVLAYVIDVVGVTFHQLPLAGLLVFLTMPIAIINIKKLYSPKIEDLIYLDRESAKLQLLFGVLVIVSVLI